MSLVILLLALLCGWSLSYGGWGGGLFAGMFALLLAIAVRQDLRVGKGCRLPALGCQPNPEPDASGQEPTAES